MRERGWSLPELLTVMALISLASLVVVPRAVSLARAGRARAAVREIASELQALRWKSVAGNRGHGLWFSRGERGWHWYVVRDENGNGLRTAEIRSGVDRTLSGPHWIEDSVSGAELGFPVDGAFPSIPPRRGEITPLDDPVHFGRSDLISISPMGSASSGTLYVTSGRELMALVLFGPSLRIRVWRFEDRSRTWKG